MNIYNKYFTIDKAFNVKEYTEKEYIENDIDKTDTIGVIKYSITNDAFIPFGFFPNSKNDKFVQLYNFKIESEYIPLTESFKIIKLIERKDSNIKRNYYRELKIVIQDSQGNLESFKFKKEPNNIPFTTDEIRIYLLDLVMELGHFHTFYSMKKFKEDLINSQAKKINDLIMQIRNLKSRK